MDAACPSNPKCCWKIPKLEISPTRTPTKSSKYPMGITWSSYFGWLAMAKIWAPQISPPNRAKLSSTTSVCFLSQTSRRKRCRPTKMMKMSISSQRGAFFSLKTSPKKRSIYFVNNNPSMTSAWKRATATFSQIFFNVSAVVSIRFLPVHSHRHWKERMHFHIWGLRAWPFFEGKLPGMASLRTFQNPSTWPVWILTFPLFFRVLVRQKLPWLWLHCCKRRPYFLAKAG